MDLLRFKEQPIIITFSRFSITFKYYFKILGTQLYLLQVTQPQYFFLILRVLKRILFFFDGSYLQSQASYKFNFLYSLRRFFNFLYFNLVLAHEHPYYFMLNAKNNVEKYFSIGFILKLYGIKAKSIRRLPSKHAVVINFFNRFFKKRLRALNTSLVFVGYRRKYHSFIETFLMRLGRLHCSLIYTIPCNRMQRYTFRRVKAIKRRLKKKLMNRLYARH